MTIWATKHLLTQPDRERAVLAFIQTVQDSEPLCDFARFAHAWVWLPELHSQWQELPQPSKALEAFVASVHDLMVSQPMHGVKILTILCCNEMCAQYPKSLALRLTALLAQSLEAPNVPRRQVLEWGIHCWRNWPNRGFAKVPDALIAPLLRQLVLEAEVAPDWALGIFMGLQRPRNGFGYAFSGSLEDAWDTVRLGRVLRHLEPRILTQSLQAFLRNARQGIAGYQPGEDTIRQAADELHAIARSQRDTQWVESEAALQCLVLYAFPDEAWYAELFDTLWSIEAPKTARNDRSFKSLAILAVNGGCNSRVRAMAEDAFLAAAMDFKNLDRDPSLSVMHTVRNTPHDLSMGSWLEAEPMERHASLLIEAVSGALHEQYPQTRNRLLPVPQECRMADHAVAAYWAMVDWLQQADPRLYFQVLVVGIENRHFHTAQTNAVEALATQRLLDGFGDYVHANTQGGIDLFAFMMSRSAYTTSGPKLGKVLDHIYPLFQVADATAASQALELGKLFKQSHMMFWRPRLAPSRSAIS